MGQKGLCNNKHLTGSSSSQCGAFVAPIFWQLTGHATRGVVDASGVIGPLRVWRSCQNLLGA
eukprot:5244192-Amphidinium_carterae.1